MLEPMLEPLLKLQVQKNFLLSAFTCLYRVISLLVIFIILFTSQDAFFNTILIRYMIVLSCCIILFLIYSKHKKMQIFLLCIEYLLIYCYAYVEPNSFIMELIGIPPVIVTLAFLLPRRYCPVIIFTSGIIGPLLFSYGFVNNISIMLGDYLLPFIVLTLSVHIPVSLLSILLNIIYDKKEKAEDGHLNLQLENKKLNQINHAISQRIFSLQNDSAQKERNRLSKEIHDTTGYVFINLIMMLQAIRAILHRDISKADKLIGEARDYAERGINEIRHLLRDIRSYTPTQFSLQNELHDLGESFQKATGVEIVFEYGDWPKSISEKTDSFFISFMQEALTNALKHGNASQISVQCWSENRRLGMSILDNGSGAIFPINKGIGITAMEDVVSEYGGSIAIKSDMGFKITAVLEIPDNIDSLL